MAVSQLSNAAKVENALGDLRKLPLLPATAQEAMALANDDSSNLQGFSRLVEKDVTLASSILKLANSPIFSWGRSIDSVSQAVVRLGLRECQNLMVAVSMGNMFQQSDPKTKGFCAVLWKHCFLTGCLCRSLNQQLHFDYHGEEFTAGLLHDLGRILFAVKAPTEFLQADPMDFIEGPEILTREFNVFQTDHCKLGMTYAEQNRLPASTVTAIRYHHEPAGAADHRGILGLVAVADHMANFLQRNEDPSAYNLVSNPGFEFLTKSWTAEKTTELKRIAPRLLKDTAKVTTPRPVAAPPAANTPNQKPIVRTEDDSTVWGNVRSWLGG
jgi:HD-like signal output (HDOD) protein